MSSRTPCRHPSPPRRGRGLLLAAVLLPAAGCAPTLVYRSDTEIKPDLTCTRRVMVAGRPGKRMPNLRVKLTDYLRFPDAARYDKFVLTAEKALMEGRFKDPLRIPADFIKLTPDTKRTAGNRVLFRTVNLGLVRVMEYEERFADIVDRRDGERAMEALGRELLELLNTALERSLDEEYDVSRLQAYLREHLPATLRRLYARLWEIRRARRGGIELLTESKEWKQCILAELDRLGYSPARDPRERPLQDILLDFLDGKLKELVTPRKAGTAPLGTGRFKRKSDRLQLLATLQEVVKAKYGSTQNFSKKIQPLLVRSLGAFLVRQVAILPLYPKIEFQVRLVLPGHIVQTNGLRDVDGSIIWTFSDNEVALSGYGMWARSLLVNRRALAAVGLRGFPRHLYDVERLYQCLRDPRSGKLCAPVMRALEECTRVRSLQPLKSLAAATAPGSGDGAGEKGAGSTAATAAAKVLSLLERFAAPPAPAPPAGDRKNAPPTAAPTGGKTEPDASGASGNAPPSTPAKPAPPPAAADQEPEPEPEE